MTQIRRYNYYVEENIPTLEPTESVTVAPTILSTDTNTLQFIIGISMVTSVITTYFVLIFSYFCVVLRKKLKRQYLEDSTGSSFSSQVFTDSDVQTANENRSMSVSTFSEAGLVGIPYEPETRRVPVTQDIFWFEDIYTPNKEESV